MIVVRLLGGLGNQMFQYALGRHLAERRGTDLKLDVLDLDASRHRPYALGALAIRESFAAPGEIAALRGPERTAWNRWIRFVLRRKEEASGVFREKTRFVFDPAVLESPDGTYLDGFWQNERYFRDIAEILRREFTPKDPPTGRNASLAAEIRSSESVSVHVRRGDYVTNPRTSRFHGTCSVAYYHACLERMTSMLGSPRFFVFGDDPEWAREHVVGDRPMTLIDQNAGALSHEDLRLMSGCKHHVLANSSFSWWGAWLNPSPPKIVLAPRQWLRGDDASSNDILPEGWIRM